VDSLRTRVHPTALDLADLPEQAFDLALVTPVRRLRDPRDSFPNPVPGVRPVQLEAGCFTEQPGR